MRYLATLSVLPRAPRGLKASEILGLLADLGYHVDLRTVQRDLSRMSRGFPIVATDEKAPRWSWDRRAPPVGLGGLDPPLALAIVLAGTHFRAMMPSGLRRALEPLMASARKALDAHDGGVAAFERRFRVLPHAPPLETPDFDATVLEGVTRALTARRRVRLVRRLARRKTREEVVTPVGLVASGATLYLVALAGEARAPRAFPLHRLRAAEVLAEPAETNGFDLDAFLAAGGPGAAWRGPAVELVARFRGAAAELIRETPFAGGATVEAIDDDEVRVRAVLEDSAELRAWLFGFGPDVRVEAPAEMARELAARARATAARYRRGRGT
jgi:predicted DNA-binding transcriptional regulator YafY